MKHKSPPKWEDCHYEIKEILTDILSDKANFDKNISFDLNQTGDMAIRMFATLAMYVYVGKKVKRFSIRQEYYRNVDELFNIKPEKLRAGWSIIDLDSTQSLRFYNSLIHAIYEYESMRSSGNLFSCCSRYKACSDALQCVSPYPELQRACSYRTKLLKGLVYYGRNRNV